MFLILWRFRPKPGREDAFLSAYGSDGDWARLFRQAEGFLGTELWRSRSNPAEFLTFDRWQSEAAYWRFRQRFHAAYSDLDARLSYLADEEAMLGTFDSVGIG